MQRSRPHRARHALLVKQTWTLTQPHPVMPACLDSTLVRLQLFALPVLVAQPTKIQIHLLHVRSAEMVPTLLKVRAPADHVRLEQPT